MLVGTADNLKMFSGIRKYINVLLSEKSRDFSLVQPKFVMFACFSYRSVIFAIVWLMTQPRTDFKTKLKNLCNKQTDFMLPCVCLVIDPR